MLSYIRTATLRKSTNISKTSVAFSNAWMSNLKPLLLLWKCVTKRAWRRVNLHSTTLFLLIVTTLLGSLNYPCSLFSTSVFKATWEWSHSSVSVSWIVLNFLDPTIITIIYTKSFDQGDDLYLSSFNASYIVIKLIICFLFSGMSVWRHRRRYSRSPGEKVSGREVCLLCVFVYSETSITPCVKKSWMI